MTFGNLKKIALARLRGAKNAVGVANTEIILNEGATDVASKALALPTDTTFNVTANQSNYNLSTLISDYLVPTKTGLWWNNGSNWKKLDPYTLSGLDEQFPTWRDHSAGSPQRYAIEGNICYVDPKPNTTLTSGFHLYYAKKPATMTKSGDYPFGGSSEIPHLAPLSWPILYFFDWAVLPMLGKRDDFQLRENTYLRQVEIRTKEIKRRLDINKSKETKFSMGTIC